MHTDKAIAEFEAWWDRQIWHECFEDVKDQMRNVWLASRRELVIDLPSDPNEEFSDRRAAVYACRLAIEAAGVTVRG